MTDIVSDANLGGPVADVGIPDVGQAGAEVAAGDLASHKTCQALTRDGRVCGAPRREGRAFCIMHDQAQDSRDLMALARRRGGQAAMARLEVVDLGGPLDWSTREGVLKTIVAVMEACLAGRLDSGRARNLLEGASAVLRVLKEEEQQAGADIGAGAGAPEEGAAWDIARMMAGELESLDSDGLEALKQRLLAIAAEAGIALPRAGFTRGGDAITRKLVPELYSESPSLPQGPPGRVGWRGFDGAPRVVEEVAAASSARPSATSEAVSGEASPLAEAVELVEEVEHGQEALRQQPGDGEGAEPGRLAPDPPRGRLAGPDLWRPLTSFSDLEEWVQR
jgi:hypothetical protein